MTTVYRKNTDEQIERIKKALLNDIEKQLGSGPNAGWLNSTAGSFVIACVIVFSTILVTKTFL